MFRLHRHKSDKSAERIDFSFSNFQIPQVPKGWDKLFVSIISVETGKTVAKSSKALVRNGKCVWKESLAESITISPEDASQEIEDKLVKLVVSMGSVRSGILGEANINLRNYVKSKSPLPVSLPLKKNNYGTILQVKIHCLNPRGIVRDEKLQETTPPIEDVNADCDEIDSKSDISDNSYARSVGSSSSNHLGSSSHPGEVGSRNTSFSASGSRHSSDSAEGFADKIGFSPRHNFSGDLYSPIDRQDSYASQNGAINGVGPAEDLPSSHSSFNSRITTTGSNLHSQRQELAQNSTSLAMSSLRNTSSSKELLDAAEDTIEQLRAEAKMWERNARKLMVDLELSRKESTDQSRHQADWDMELSMACTERDGLKQENEKLKAMLEESKSKHMASEHFISQEEGRTNIHKELENEIKFQKESNHNLAVQLEKSQESNIELVSILQELEETIEKQRLEIDKLSEENEELSTENFREEGTEHLTSKENQNAELELQMLKESQHELQTTVHLLEKRLMDKNKELEREQNQSQALLVREVDWKAKLSKKEEEMIKVEAKLSDLLNAQGSVVNKFSDGDSELMKEIEELKEKVQVLESDCNELTEENLELIFKLKDSKKDLQIGGDSVSSASSELQSTASVAAFEPEVDLLRSHIDQLKQELMNKEALCEGVRSTHQEVQLIDLQKKITDLEHQLHSSHDNACDLDAQLRNCQVEMENRAKEITSLKQLLASYQDKPMNNELQHTLSETTFEKFESRSSVEMSGIFSALQNQVQVALARIKRPWCNGSSHVRTESDTYQNDIASDCTNNTNQKFQAEGILKSFVELNELLEAKLFECETIFQRTEAELTVRNTSAADARDKPEEDGVKGNSLYHSNQGTETAGFETGRSLTEEDIEVLKKSQKELEAQISDLQKEKVQLQENLEAVTRESNLTSKCLDDARNDMMALTRNLDSHVSANTMLERKSSELESSKHEIELHLLQLEEENVQLSERLSGMEAQLRYMTDEKESSRLELENSKTHSKELRSEINRLEAEMELQKVDLKHKLTEMQKRWSEAQEECEYLMRANPKLQATAENLIEECDSLQKLNGELRKQKLELHDRCTHLEAELKESRNDVSDCCKKIEILESKFSLMQEEVLAKERILTSELDSLLLENKEHKEKLILEENLLSQMYMEKTVEVDNLQRELAHFTEQISATYDEREKIASNAVLEVSTLRADKEKMESALQEAQAKLKSTEIKLHSVQLESETKVQGLIGEISSNRKNQHLIMADNEKLQRLLDEVKYSEEKLKSTVGEVELRLTTSEYERQQLVEEIAHLKFQLQKIGQLQDEIVSLKNSLSEVKFEKDKLEASLQLLSGDCEELKAEKNSFIEKISSMQKAVSELDDCRRCKIALEEKLLRLEGDLTAKEAFCVQDAELKNELNRMKRANSQLQRKIQCLEDEKDKLMKRSQTMEQELRITKEEKQHQSNSLNNDLSEYKSKGQGDLPSHELGHSENGLERNNSAENMMRSGKIVESIHYQKEDDNKHNGNNGTLGADLVSKVQLLENELAEALEANTMYKAQLKQLLSDEENIYVNGLRKSASIEAELKDIRDRYFHMSLRFAEVEAQREDLVMQMKSLKSSGRRWFS